jgi:hypothetical protein
VLRLELDYTLTNGESHEAGHHVIPVSPTLSEKEYKRESREGLIRYLEQLSGRKIRTREDVRTYAEEISTRKDADDRLVRLVAMGAVVKVRRHSA